MNLMLLRKRTLVKIQRIIRYILYFLFRFDKWHLNTFKERNYAQSIVKYLNDNTSRQKLNMVEIGCGLGDIIRNIKINYKVSSKSYIKYLFSQLPN